MDLFPGEGVAGVSISGSPTGDMGAGANETSMTTDIYTIGNVQDRDDDADPPIGLSESPAFTSSPLPLPPSQSHFLPVPESECELYPEPTPSILITITVTPHTPLEPKITLYPPPLPTPPALPAAYTSSTPGSTARKRSCFYASRSPPTSRAIQR